MNQENSLPLSSEYSNVLRNMQFLTSKNVSFSLSVFVCVYSITIYILNMIYTYTYYLLIEKKKNKQ